MKISCIISIKNYTISIVRQKMTEHLFNADFDEQPGKIFLFRNVGKADGAVFSGEDPVKIISRGMDFDHFPIKHYGGRFAAAEFEERIIPGQRYFQLRIERFPELHVFPESQFRLISAI